MRSNSAEALPQTNVPVPGVRSLLATKLNVHVAPAHEELETLFAVVHVPPVQEKKSLVPAALRVEPWSIHPCSCSPVTGWVPTLKFAVAVPSKPPISSVAGLTLALMMPT